MTDAAELLDRSGSPDRSARWRLLDERDFLRRSLDDAEREHAAGDLADADYTLLRRRDEARLASVEAALAALDEPTTAPAAPTDPAAGSDNPAAAGEEGVAGGVPAVEGAVAAPAGAAVASRSATGRREGRRGGRRPRRWLAVGGVALLVAGAVVLVVNLARPRLPGQLATGSIDLSQSQKEARQLQQAQALVNGGHPAQALRVYAQVLTEDPKDPVALAELGWLEWQAATSAKEKNAATDAEAMVARAVKLEPSLYAAQYYLGVILLQDGQATQAVTHFQAFLADHPSAKWRRDAASAIRQAFTEAGQPVPAGVPATSGSTSP